MITHTHTTGFIYLLTITNTQKRTSKIYQNSDRNNYKSTDTENIHDNKNTQQYKYNPTFTKKTNNTPNY